MKHMVRRLVCLAAVATAGVVWGTDYYLIGGDAIDQSSLSGTSSAGGWATTPGGALSARGMTAGNAYFVAANAVSSLRTPKDNIDYATVAPLTVEQGASLTVNLKLAGNKKLTLNNFTLEEGATTIFSTSTDGMTHTLAGNWTCAEDSVIVLPCSAANSSDVRQLILGATLTGTGTIRASPSSENAAAGARVNKITGDLSGWTGDIEVYGGFGKSLFTLELVNAASVPADTAEASVTVTNGAILKVDADWTSPATRTWDFGSAGNVPTINVAAGKTVTIQGPVFGSVGLNKTGDGTLTLAASGPDPITVTGAGSVDAATLAAYAEASQANFSVAPIDPVVYAGSACCPKPTVTDANGVVQTENEGYRLSYANNEAAGEASVIVTGEGELHGVRKVNFTILSSAFDIAPIPPLDCSTGFGRVPSGLTVTNRYTGARLSEGVDYTVSATDNDGIGTATAIVTGQGEYAYQVATAPFTITATRLDDENISTDDPSVRMTVVDGKYVYSFTNAAAAISVRAKKGLVLESYLLVGGGGAGGNTMGGGGGGGGVTNATGLVGVVAAKDETFTVQVGKGGTRGGTGQQAGKDGDPTAVSFGGNEFSVVGGGGGGGWGSTAGKKGGSGGGGCNSGAGGAGTEGLGFAGAKGNGSSKSGGGGGAGGVGLPAANSRAGQGGPGVTNSITGVARCYGGGGGGGGSNNGWDGYNFGYGGTGGGGDGGKGTAGSPGAPGTGGGGGGGGWTGGDQYGGAGGSGCAILVVSRQVFDIAPIEPQYIVEGGARPTPVVRDPESQAVLTEGEDGDYVVEYENNTARGEGRVKVTGRGDYAGKVAYARFKVVMLYRVTNEGTDGGSGQSWQSSMTLAKAIETAVAEDLIYMKAGRYVVSSAITVDKPITIKGGFKGTDDVTLDETNPLSVLDTDRNTSFGSIMSVTAATAGFETRLERLGFKYGYARGLYKKGASDLVVDSCLIMTNGLSNSGTGKGALVESASGATITFRNTEFRANRQETDTSGCSPNPALSLGGCKEVLIENCGFFGNSLIFTAPGTGESSGQTRGDKFTCGSAIYTTVKTTVVGSRFSGNCVNIRSTSTSGGTIWFASGSANSVVSNCLFYGNYDRTAWNTGAHQGGCIVQSMGSATDKLKVVGSTFAYNLADGTDCAAGISVVKGTLDLEDSVFGGNMVNWSTTSKSIDLIVKDTCVANVRNTVFGQDEANSYYCTVRGTLNLCEGVVFADPQFVTRPETITAIVQNSGGRRIFKTDLASYVVLEKIDAHLLSAAGYRSNTNATYVTADVHSPAIDGAAATAPVGAEPAPNAGRRNAGFWGGTAEASMSSLGVPTIADADISVEFDALTHPTVNAAIGGTAAYNATFKIETFASDPRTDATAAAIESSARYGAQSGATLQLVGGKLYVPRSTLYVRVTAAVPGLDPVVFVKEVEVQGDVPAYYGHGGGANVIHVRGGANEACDGHDWTDAFPTLEQALAAAAADATKDEIWIMGTAVSTEQITTSFDPAAAKLTIRGGFTGVEDDAASRPADGVTYVDGQGLYNGCILGNTTGHDVAVERVGFMRMALNGITKTGGGDLLVESCLFLTNSTASAQEASWTGKGVAGRAIRVSSAGGANIVVTNCQIRANRQTSTGGNGGPGAALSFSGCASALVVDCKLHRNGVEMEENGSGSSSNSKNGDSGSLGSAIYTTVPTTVLRCEFSANGNNICSSWTSGGTLWFETGSQGSVVSNCLFKGNEDRGCWDYSGTIGGAIVVRFGNKTDVLTVTGSTFAYNLTDGKTAGAGMTVIKGTVDLSNCVFGGNIIPPSSLEPSSDLRIKADGVVNASYTVFGEERGRSIQCAGAFNEGAGLVFRDPLFVTTPSAVSNLVRRQASGYTYYYKASISAIEAIDCHLLSSAGYVTNGIAPGEWLQTDGVNSPAIDAGTGDYVNEPDFNGNCRNAGYYGNTAEASKTYQSAEPLGFDNLAVTYPDGYSRPQIEFDVTGDAGCLVTVHAVVTVGGEELVYDLPGCAAGEKSTIALPEYYERGTALAVVLSGTSSSGTVSGNDMETTIEADRPVWYGHGGGEGVLHLWSGAPGRGDGSDWHNAFTKWADLVAAYNKTNGITEIWIIDTASPTAVAATLNATANLAIRGGFAYTNDTLEARTPGAVSTLDARKLFGLVYLSNGAGKDVEVERLVFTRATDTGFVKSGAGNITFTDCSFVANARDLNGNYNGRGVRITGTASTTEATFVNCVFAGNAAISGGGYNLGYGAGGYFKDLSRVTLDGCLFVSNGVNICAGPAPNYGGDISQGSAAYFNNAPLTARNCRFACNNGTCRNNSYVGGGALRFVGSSGGSVMMNCAIVGSFDRAGWTGTDQLGSHGGAIVVAFSDAAQTLDLENCTVAYNLSDGKDCPGGLLVSSGTVTARNSIFFGNQRNGYSKDNGAGSDVVVRSGSKFAATYCLFTDDTAESVTSADAEGKDIDWETCLTGDPLFVTPLETYLAKTAYNGKYRYHTGSYDFYANLDVHLQSRGGYWLNDGTEVTDGVVTSQALDKGDPSSDCSQEPPFDGECINLGAYGNTEHASRTSFGQPKVDALEVVYANGYSRPWISLKLGLESGDPCSCDVTITCTTGDVVVASQSFVGVATGDWVRFAPSVYLNAGDGLKVAVTVSAPGATPVEGAHEGTVTGVKPIWAGKGGGERVIHVRAGADGLATGRDWTDAYPDLKSAIAAIKPGYDALWIAGELVVTNALSEPSLTYDFAIRGGFDGHENAPEERHDSIPYATLDFSNKVDGVRLSSTMPLTVERVRFTRATSRGFYKTGKGQTILANCVFAQNTGGSAVSGRGAYLSCDGNVNTGTIGLITNCVFEGNCLKSGTSNGSGVGLYVANFRSMEIVDTLFVSNGVAWAAAAGYDSPGRDAGQGAALFSDTAPVKARNVRFLANRITTRNDNRGGIVIVNNSRGSVFANCLWLGNQETFGWNSRDYTGSYSGALVMNLGHSENDLTVANCTIALNLSDQTGSGSGITVRGGRLNLRNSIVAGNLTGNYCTGSRDLTVLSGASVDVSYTLFSSNDVSSVSASVVPGEGVLYGDPLLVTRTADAKALVVKSGVNVRFAADKLEEVAAFNGHLRGLGGYYDETDGQRRAFRGNSPALNAGDPASDYSGEPTPNGRCVNMGAYGNTPWATMSKTGTMLLVR